MNFWKYLFVLTKNKEEGFTIPLILGFGLFMLAIGFTSIKLSSTSEINSKAQERTHQAQAAAELGLVRVQELLDERKYLAVYNDCSAPRAADGTCADGGLSPQPASWFNIEVAASDYEDARTCGAQDLPAEIDTFTEVAEGGWVVADANDSSKGEYRLISYNYDAAAGLGPNETPGIGTLVIEGRTNQFDVEEGGDGVINTGTSRLRVEIPIRTATRVEEFSMPGLWILFNEFANMGDHKVRGDIMVEDVNCLGGGAVPALLSQQRNISEEGGEFTGEITATPQAMPDTPALPGTTHLNFIQSPDIFDRGITLPRAGDVEYQGAYHYIVPNLDNSGGSDLSLEAGKRVIFYVQGNITFSGSINDGTEPQNLQIYGNTTVDTGTGFRGTNYKYGCDPIVAKNGRVSANSCPTQALKLSGTADINAFVHAPEAWACLSGGGSGLAVSGALWINQWTAVSSNVPTSIRDLLQASSCTNADKVVIDFRPETLPPEAVLSIPVNITFTEPNISPLASWEKQSR